MNMHRTATILGIATAVSFLGTGIAQAVSIPSSAASLIPVRIDKPDTLDSFNDLVDCRTQGDRSHPYLVLDEDVNGHNEHRLGRHTTYHTGDGVNLGFLEHMMAGGGVIVLESEYFNNVHIAAHLTGPGGHGSVTFYCANTAEAAHQK